MRPEDGSLPGRRMAQEGLARVRQAVRSASLPVKILLVLAVLIIIVLALALGARFWDLLVVAALVYGPVAVWRGHRSWVASVFVGAWGLAAILAIAAVAGRFSSGVVPLLLLPCAAVAVSHLRVLSRRYVPCRTVAWTQLWALPPGVLAWWLAPGRLVISYAIAWVLGLAVIGWRIGKSQQEARALSRQQGRSGALAAPHRPGGAAMAARPAGRPRPRRAPARPGPPTCRGWCRRPRDRCARPTAPPPGTGPAATSSHRISRSPRPWPSSTT